MSKITNILPKAAVQIADTAEYAAWSKKLGTAPSNNKLLPDLTGFDVWIEMKEPNTFVTDAIMTEIASGIYNKGGSINAVHIPGGIVLGANDKKPPVVNDQIEAYVHNFGVVEVIAIAA